MSTVGEARLSSEEKRLFVRATAVIIKDNCILLLKQATDHGRAWSLPGGKQEPYESLGEAVIRECKEETGLEVEVIRLLYVADHVAGDTKRILHITFLVKVVGGSLGDIDRTADSEPIKSVEYVSIKDLQEYGFSEKFQAMIQGNFPGTGEGVYVGAKSNIGL